TPLDTILQLLEQEPERPRRLNPNASRDLETIALKCLDKDPTRRYGSADAIVEDLARWLRGEPIVARSVTAIERAWKWGMRRPGIAALLLSVIGAVVGGFAGMTNLYLRAEAEREQTTKEKLIARDMLIQALAAQARAERLAGKRWESLKALA